MFHDASGVSRHELPTASIGFHTTHWTMVLAARDKDGAGAQEALAALCSTYWYPVYAFVRRQGSSPHDGEDLTQEFFSRLLQRNALRNVHPSAGKFRSFMLACLKNFLANEHERAQAQRRGGDRQVIPLDSTDAETRYSLEPADNQTPETIFERRWAFAVLERTMRQLRHDFTAADKVEFFEQLQGFLPGGGAGVSREELAAKRGVSVGAIDVAIHRLRQRFGMLLREEILKTVSSEAEVEEEIRYLISVIGS